MMGFFRAIPTQCVLAACLALPVWAANYPLQITYPVASGTSPDVGRANIDSDHRVFWAYAGLQYNIKAAVRGGTLPLTFSLTSAPSGMVVNSSTGVVTWIASADGTNSGTITLHVVDAEASSTDVSWVVTVQNSKFKFIDSEASCTCTGSISQPYNDAVVVKDGTITQDFIIYFRGRTTPYTLRGAAYSAGTSYGQFRRVQLNAATRSIQWLAYPGDPKPILDEGGPLDRVTNANINTTNDTFTLNQYVMNGGTMANGDSHTTGNYVTVQTVTDDANGTATTFPSPLVANTGCYIIRVDANTIKLAANLTDAQNGTAIDITTTGAAGSITVIGMPYLEWQGVPGYFEGFRVINAPNKALDFIYNIHFGVVRGNEFYNQYGGGNGQNSSFFMTEHGGGNIEATDALLDYLVLQDNSFDTFRFGSAVKLYSLYKPVVDGNVVLNGTSTTGNLTEGIAFKGGWMKLVSARQNTLHDIPDTALDGNNHTIDGGEWTHNLIYNSTNSAIRLNNDGSMLTPFHVQRNTVVGPVEIRPGINEGLIPAELAVGTTNSDIGPIYLTANVFVNPQYANTIPGVTFIQGDTNTDTIVQTNQLVGQASDGIVDANGLLLLTTYLGTRGHEIVSGSAPRFVPGLLRLAEVHP